MNLNKLQTYTKKRKSFFFYLIKKPKWSDSKIVNKIYFILFYFFLWEKQKQKNLSLNKRNINT